MLYKICGRTVKRDLVVRIIKGYLIVNCRWRRKKNRKSGGASRKKWFFVILIAGYLSGCVHTSIQGTESFSPESETTKTVNEERTEPAVTDASIFPESEGGKSGRNI